MLVLLAGDTHTSIDKINVAVRNLRKQRGIEVALALQVGDFGFYRDYGDWKAFIKGTYKFEVPVIAVHGNHENETSARLAMGEFGSYVPNFKCLKEGGEYFEFEAGGETLRLFGVGGAPCVDNPPRNEKFEFDPLEYEVAYGRWVSLGKPEVDVLLTHECPRGTGMLGDPRIAAMFGLDPNIEMGESKLTSLVVAMQPRWQVNGHHHRLWGPLTLPGTITQHLTLPVIQQGYAVLDTATWEVTTVGVR